MGQCQNLRQWILELTLTSLLIGSGVTLAQTTPSTDPLPHPVTSDQPAAPSTSKASPADCVDPAPMFSAEDYSGPLKKLLTRVAGKPEIKTVHTPHHKPGLSLCALNVPEKFHLFMSDTFEPVSYVTAGLSAAQAHLQDDDSNFGRGAGGFAKRYAAAFTDQVSSGFFETFLYPSIFREDPRYYRMRHGTFTKRLLHAASHTFIAPSDRGRSMFNYSEWLGTASSTALGNLYHPGNSRGFQPAARNTAINIGVDMGFDILREFWPEIAHRLKLPFTPRDHLEPKLPSQSSVSK
jgi:hypothetical protein